MIEEFQHQRNAIGKHQMLWHKLKLIDVIDFQVFQVQQQNGRNCFDDNLFVTIHVDAQFRWLCYSHAKKKQKKVRIK